MTMFFFIRKMLKGKKQLIKKKEENSHQTAKVNFSSKSWTHKLNSKEKKKKKKLKW